jgi:arginine deiminase
MKQSGNPDVCILSEIGLLKRVIVRRPGEEISKVTPSNAEELLFDDIVDPPLIKEEHDIFVRALTRLGVEVIYLDNLSLEVLEADSRNVFLKNVINVGTGFINSLGNKCDAKSFLDYLIIGDSIHPELGPLNPAPNSIFTRDIGCIVGNKFLPAIPFKAARFREMSIAQETLSLHPDFDLEVISSQEGFSIEGGDIQVLSKDVIVFGVSERTSKEAVKSIVEELHEEGFNLVLTVDIGKARSCMHLDTVFTMINNDECLVYEPLILGNDEAGMKKAKVVVYQKGLMPIICEDSLLDVLNSLGIKLKPIACGGRKDLISQEREQWTDGANALAFQPGGIFVYERNRKTIEELIKHGYQTIRAEDVKEPLVKDQKWVVILQGKELSRGRGGSHCLSFPLLRV